MNTRYEIIRLEDDKETWEDIFPYYEQAEERIKELFEHEGNRKAYYTIRKVYSYE